MPMGDDGNKRWVRKVPSVGFRVDMQWAKWNAWMHFERRPIVVSLSLRLTAKRQQTTGLTDELPPYIQTRLVLDCHLPTGRSCTVHVTKLCIRAVESHGDRVIQSPIFFH